MLLAACIVMVKVMHLCVCVWVCLQTGERINVAIKTCKDTSADIKEKFLSEAGECAAVAVIIFDNRNTFADVKKKTGNVRSLAL